MPPTGPSLPSAPRPSPLPGYALSTHLVPSVLPRNTQYIKTLESLTALDVPSQEVKESRRALLARATDDLLTVKRRFDSGEPHKPGNTYQLWNCVNRYVRTDAEQMKDRSNALTLLCLHATGLHKETFEHLLRYIVDRTVKDSAYEIPEIWSFEAVQHGDAALVNRGQLGVLFNWIDNARDVLNFLLHYLPETASSSALPIHLERISSSSAAARSQSGFTHRRLVGIGHSFGGTTMIHAAYRQPALFADNAIILIDPICQPRTHYDVPFVRPYVLNALARRSSWPSRDEAFRQLKASPFFSLWDDGALYSFTNYGLYQAEDGEVHLKCEGVQEAAVYADIAACSEAWAVLPQLDPRVAMKWILPLAHASALQDQEIVEERLLRRPGNSSQTIIPSGSHMLVQDSPKETSHEIQLLLRELALQKRPRL